MISNIYCKINEFDEISEKISEINSKKIGKNDISAKQLTENFRDLKSVAILQQELLPKTSIKLPHWVEAGCIFDRRAYEQCTSEAVARWKAKEYPSKKLLSLTGGLGVDDWAWAKLGTEVQSYDIDPNLNHLCQFNFKKLGVTVKRNTGDFANELTESELKNFDLVYIDPDRRDGETRLGGQINLYSPNISELLEKFKLIDIPWLIKLSPLTDIHWLHEQLPGKKEFTSVVYAGEVKELLLFIHPSKPMELLTDSVVIQEEESSRFRSAKNINFHECDLRLFEPNAGLICVRIHRELEEIHGIKAITPQKTFFEISVDLPRNWGRQFEPVLEPMVGSLNSISKKLIENNITAASITARECGIPTEQIKKTLKLKENSEFTLLITKHGQDFKAWYCRKII